MNPATDKGRKRILGSMLPQHVGQSVCLVGTLVQLESSGRVLKMKTSDDQHVTVQLQQPKEANMKVINLSHKDPDIFQTSVTSSRCDFIINHFEAFMQMYKSQGSTFWLRFLISFKTHMEEKVYTSKKFFALLVHCNFIKILNYIYICIHKKFIESSNTAVKKFINNLSTLALNSPSFLNYSCDHWIMFLKSSKQLQNIFQNVSGISDPCEYDGFTVLIYTVYTDFLCALCAVFEQWCEKSELTDEEIKKVDTKIIYWLPICNADTNIKIACFERYILDFWKEDLQRILLTDDIHDIYGIHETSGCCEKYAKEKSLCNIFQFTNMHTMELMKVMNCAENMGEQEKGDNLHTVTEICLKDIFTLKPHVKHCSDHKNCYVRISHNENCLEPFLCRGILPCVLTCETKIKEVKKEQKPDKFWKNVAVEKFCIDENKCDASTVAESYDKFIETYLHIKEEPDMECPLSMLRHTYQCMAEFKNFDFNPRKTECLNRLRKKLTQKHPSNSYQFNFRQPFYRESLLEHADRKMLKMQTQVCLERNHSVTECEGKCFMQDVNTVAIGSSNIFGRVINLTKTYISVPPMLACNCSNEVNHNKETESQRSECKKSIKAYAGESKSGKNSESRSVKNYSADVNCNPCEASEDVSTDLKEGIEVNPSVGSNEDSEINAADEIDEILKLIGISEDEANNQKSADNVNREKICSNHGMKASVSKQEEAVDKFLKLIGVNVDEFSTDKAISEPSISKNCDTKLNLKTCAYCKKKETQRKMFKKCSKCKEENFPIQHYYCSQECLIEDWVESHEEEHLKYQKSSS